MHHAIIIVFNKYRIRNVLEHDIDRYVNDVYFIYVSMLVYSIEYLYLKFLSDISYDGCVELQGDEVEIIEQINVLFLLSSSSYNNHLIAKVKIHHGGEFVG